MRFKFHHHRGDHQLLVTFSDGPCSGGSGMAYVVLTIDPRNNVIVINAGQMWSLYLHMHQ